MFSYILSERVFKLLLNKYYFMNNVKGILGNSPSNAFLKSPILQYIPVPFYLH